MKLDTLPEPYTLMKERPHLLEHLEMKFRWGHYGIHVLKFHLTKFSPGEIVGFHKHSEFEFHFIPGGKGQVIMEDRVHPLHGGLFYLTGPNVIHYQEADAAEAMDELCLHIEIVPLHTLPQSLMEWGGEQEALEAEDCIRKLHSLPAVPAADKYEAMQCFVDAYKAMQENHPGRYETIKQCVIQILLRAVRAYDDSPSRLPLPHRNKSASQYQIATQFIKDNFMLPLTLESAAQAVGISGRQLQRVFRQHTSGTFTDYLENVRLSHICTALVRETSTIEEIAVRCGFENVNYLYQVFKKRFHMTPKMFKETYGKIGRRQAKTEGARSDES